MARVKLQQNSLITGSISPTLLGRIDLEKYYNAVEEAENVVIMPHGGMKRRGGLKNIASVDTGSRLFSFEFSTTQNYVFVLSTTDINVYKPNDDTLYATISWAVSLTQAQLDEMDIIQSADTVIMVHEDFKPIEIQRQGGDTVWDIDYLTLTNIPKFDYDTTKAPLFFNYGSSVVVDMVIDDIVYNNDGNYKNGLNGNLYKAKYDVGNGDISTIDFTKETADYTNDGTSVTQTVQIGEVVLNVDGDDTDGLEGHAYRAITLRSSIDLSTEDYTDTDNWADNGLWTNEGVRPDVWGITNEADYTNDGTSVGQTVAFGEIVYNDVNGLDGHVYSPAIDDVVVADLSTEDYSDTSVWDDLGVYDSTDRGWLRTCTFHQGRLWFGGSKSKPTSVWASVVNDFYNFDTGKDDVLADDGIFDILDTDQFNAIQNIVSGTKLQVLTAGGEFVNTEDILTPTTSTWVRYTGYGAKRLKPAILDGATYFMDRFGKTVRSLIYSFEEGGYTTPPVSILSEHLINDVQDVDIVRGSSNSVSNLLYLVNADGTVAVFNTLRNENISGWTKWTTSGTFKRVTVTGDAVSFVVSRDGSEYLEVLDEDILLDHSFYTTSSDFVEVDALLLASEIRVVADNVIQTTTSAVDESGTYKAYADQTSDEVYAGLNYDVKIKTLPVAMGTRDEGNIRYLPKRVTKCIVQMHQSRGVYVNNQLITNRQFGDPTDSVFPLVTGQRNTHLLGYNKEAQIEITQNNPDPMTILALDMEISY